MAERQNPFGVLLRRHRLAAGLTQEALAERAGLSTHAISTLERGFRRMPYTSTIDLLAAALGLSPAQRDELAGSAGRRGPVGRLTGLPAAPASTPAKRTLPRDIATFTGREAELSLLLELAAEPTRSGGVVAISAIDGMAGTGKTALAVHAAHQLAGCFPDGQLFLDLRAHASGQRPLAPGPGHGGGLVEL